MGILRKTVAILKFAAFFLPGISTVGGISTLIGLEISAGLKNNKAEKQFNQTEQFAEIKENQIAKIDEKKDRMTDKEYSNIMSHIESNEFLKETMASNFIEDDNIRNLYNQALKENSISIYFLIPFFIGGVSSLLYLFDDFRDFLDISYNMVEPYFVREEKTKKKELKRREREERLYSEEVIEND